MDIYWELLPYLLAMLVLICCSAFFSSSEAALFYLRPAERRELQSGSTAERLAAKLLRDPDRLLSAVLFWNLVINVAYFALGSICAIKLEQHTDYGRTAAIGFAVATLLCIIFCSEMLPKTVAVLKPKAVARLVSIPLMVAIRVTDPIMPVLQAINLVSRRLIWPGFKPEQYLEISDLERAILLSGADAKLIKQEQAVLHNVVSLSDIRVDEWMRPRTQTQVFRPSLSVSDLEGELPNGGYILIAEAGSEEIEKAIHLDKLISLPSLSNIDRFAEPVLYLPWSATVADALEKMSKQDGEVVAVVNEYGDTIGILTVDDVLESVFAYSPSRSQRILDQTPMLQLEQNKWEISGMMSLKRLARKLEVSYPETYSVTVAGVIEQQLQRAASDDDECEFGPFHFKVLRGVSRTNMKVEVRLVERGDQS